MDTCPICFGAAGAGGSLPFRGGTCSKECARTAALMERLGSDTTALVVTLESLGALIELLREPPPTP